VSSKLTIGCPNQSQGRLDAGSALQIESDGPAVSVQDRVVARLVRVCRPVDADHIGAEIAEDHAAEGAGSDAAELDDPDAGERVMRAAVIR
jgi:hypothetical protein